MCAVIYECREMEEWPACFTEWGYWELVWVFMLHLLIEFSTHPCSVALGTALLTSCTCQFVKLTVLRRDRLRAHHSPALPTHQLFYWLMKAWRTAHSASPTRSSPSVLQPKGGSPEQDRPTQGGLVRGLSVFCLGLVTWILDFILCKQEGWGWVLVVRLSFL